MVNSTEQPVELPFYLRGNFAPVAEEVTAFDLPVDGAIPPELRGLYLRNGPNPRTGGDQGHWFIGDGMIHGVRLEGGRAQWYRNRWVRTRSFLEGAELVSADGTIDRTIGKANTNVIGHAGRIFALVESSFPTEITPVLDTGPICDFDGRLTTAMTAHPKLCAATGELHFFGYGFFPPFLTYHRLAASGELIQSIEIDVPGPTMIHDFAITERHLIFMDLPVVFDLEMAMQGRMPYRWSDDYGARLGVLPRGGSADDLRWYEIEPCYVFHPFNACERDGKIVIDVARYNELWRVGEHQFSPARAYRWSIDPVAGGVREDHLDDRAIEFPRVDDRLTGKPHRFGYAVTNHAGVSEDASALVKYDFLSGVVTTHEFAGGAPGEGVFVPAGNGEDEGYVLAYVYDASRNGSDLVILDAASFAAAPIATIHLPQRVPFGFHGNWIADAR